MGAKLKAVRTELILLGLTAVFLGGLLTVSYRDRKRSAAMKRC